VKLTPALGIAALWLVACSSKAKLVPQGGDCLQATDCADGLVCVPQTDGRRICDNDLTGVQTTEDASTPAVDAGRRDGSAEGGKTDSGPPPDADTPDTGQADTGTD
jgi:hypothetical protein